MDAWLWARLWKWACRRYKGRKNAKQKCFNVNGWQFGYTDRKTNKTVALRRHDKMKVRTSKLNQVRRYTIHLCHCTLQKGYH